MRETEESDGFDLTGVWNGQYDYPTSIAAVAFIAALTETGGSISGTTEEIGTVGRARGLAINAILQGRRTGRSVTFLKIYEDIDWAYDTVQYAGVANSEGTEISGRWTVPGVWSGTFLMVRAGRAAAKLTKEAIERV
jgi:hypothetical protein